MDKKGDPPGRIWKEVIDPSSRSVYYWNVLTGETSWQNPVPEDISLPFRERVSHDTKVIIDKLVNGVDRLKFFFDEIDLINDVCDHLRNEDISSVQSLITKSLENLDKILDVATPKTKTYNKFLDLKKFLVEQKNYLKNNSNIDEDLLLRIEEASEEVQTHYENVRKFAVRSEELLVDDYKAYIEKRKLESVHIVSSQDSVLPPESVETSQGDTLNKTKVKHDRTIKIKSIHEKWNRASELIDEVEDIFKHVKGSKGCPQGSDQDNANMVPITKPWYAKQ